MYAGVVRSVNVELLLRQLQVGSLRRDVVTCGSVWVWHLWGCRGGEQEGGIVSMTPLGSSPGGEVFYVSSEEWMPQAAGVVVWPGWL